MLAALQATIRATFVPLVYLWVLLRCASGHSGGNENLESGNAAVFAPADSDAGVTRE